MLGSVESVRHSHARPRRRWLRTSTVAIGVVVAVLAAIALLGPLLLDTSSVRAQIQQRLSPAVNGQVAWDALRVRLLPSPRAELDGVHIDTPGKAAITAHRAKISLKLVPFLLGRAEIAMITLDRPVIDVTLANGTEQPAKSPPDPIAAYRSFMNALVEQIKRFAPNTVVEIDAATVHLHGTAISPIELSNFSLRARTDVNGAEVEAASSGNLWKKLRLLARFEFSDLSSRAQIDISEINTRLLLDPLLAQTPLAISLAALDLRGTILSDAKSAIECHIEASAAMLQLARGDAKLDINAPKIKASGVAHTRELQVEVTDLQLGTLIPAARARLAVDASGERPQLLLEIPRLDLATISGAIGVLAHDGAVQSYVRRVRAGELLHLRISSRADRWPDVFDPPRMQATATLAQGTFVLPRIEQPLTQLAGRIEISNGTVQASAMSAQLGPSKLIDGTVTYRIEDESTSVDLGVNLQAQHVIDIARQIGTDRQREQLSAVMGVWGRLPGRIQAQTEHGQWRSEIAIERSDATMRIQQLPWPVALNAIHLTRTAHELDIGALRMSLGRSNIEQANAVIELGEPSRLRVKSARLSLALDELLAWLKQQPATAKLLSEITSAAGTARVAVNGLSGRVDRPAELAYDFVVQPEQVSIGHANLPAPLIISGGSARVERSTLRFDGIRFALLDLQATLSGVADRYSNDNAQFDGTIADGALGAQAMHWIWERAGAPERLLPKAPLRYSVQRLRLGPGRAIDAQAAIQHDVGRNVALDVAWTPQHLELRNVAINDRLSNAQASVSAKDRLLRVRFLGTLNGRSIAALLAHRHELEGVLDGDFQLALDRDLRGRTTARGKLRGRALDLSWLLARQVRLDQIDMEADGETLHIRDAALNWAQQSAILNGTIAHGSRGAIVDAQIESPGIDLNALLPQASDADASPAQAQRTDIIFPQLWPLPFNGRIELRADFLKYREHRISPMSATITLEERRAGVRLHDAAVCGISFPLTLDLNPERVSAAAKLSARSQQVEQTARCLTDQRVLITGAFDIRADVATSGRPGELLRNLKGTVTTRARDGRVMKLALLGNILSLASVSTLFRNGAPQLRGEGFDYRALDIDGHFHDGELIIDQAAFDSDAFGLAATGTVDLLESRSALTVLVAPFGRVDRLVRRIPVVGYVIGGTLTSVPVGVSGDIRDPRVVPLGPRAVTSQLTGIFERTLKLPATLLAPLGASPQTRQPQPP